MEYSRRRFSGRSQTAGKNLTAFYVEAYALKECEVIIEKLSDDQIARMCRPRMLVPPCSMHIPEVDASSSSNHGVQTTAGKIKPNSH